MQDDQRIAGFGQMADTAIDLIAAQNVATMTAGQGMRLRGPTP